jgi:hypothetical protein
MDLPCFEFESVHFKFKGCQYQNTKLKVESLVKTAWIGFILVAKKYTYLDNTVY